MRIVDHKSLKDEDMLTRGGKNFKKKHRFFIPN